MNYEYEIECLKKRMDNLQESFIQAQKNQTEITSKSENNINEVKGDVANVTPYTETKTAYIDDSEVIFTCNMQGCLSAYVMDENGNVPAHSIKRTQDFIAVAFDEPLDAVTNVTISIN